MKEKIDWYQEVLDLEPGSKVFFPLAKLLAQNNETLRAIDTLQHGLDRHPEFIEARLYLIELLYQSSETEDNKQKLEQNLKLLTPLFARYAGFWKAWGSNAKISSPQGDTGLAIAFLAALFQDSTLSLSEIVNKGLQMVLGEEKAGNGNVGGDGAEPTETEDLQIDAEPELASPIVVEEAVHVSAPLPAPYKEENTNFEDEDDFDEDEEGEERFSLRTRSMAEVLAEQGDYAGALEIYHELTENSSSDQEKEDLQSRMNTLSAHLGSTQEKAEPEEETTASPGKDRILSVLETLAVRLESRVNS